MGKQHGEGGLGKNVLDVGCVDQQSLFPGGHKEAIRTRLCGPAILPKRRETRVSLRRGQVANLLREIQSKTRSNRVYGQETAEWGNKA